MKYKKQIKKRYEQKPWYYVYLKSTYTVRARNYNYYSIEEQLP